MSRFSQCDCCVKIRMDPGRQFLEGGHPHMSNVKRVASPQILSRTMADQSLDVDEWGRLLCRIVGDART